MVHALIKNSFKLKPRFDASTIFRHHFKFYENLGYYCAGLGNIYIHSLYFVVNFTNK